MTRLGWTLVLGILGVLVLIGGFLIWLRMGASESEVGTEATSTPALVNPATLSIYTSGEYGFSLFYPSSARVIDAYSTTTLSGSWRVGAVGTGTPIVSLEQSGEEIQVGVSTDPKELKACLIAGPAEKTQGTVTIGDIAWSTFSFQKLGTDNEQKVTSYRIKRGSSCYALELSQSLGAEATTTGYTLKDTITSFSFAH